jgi:hypothetical protein
MFTHIVKYNGENYVEKDLNSIENERKIIIKEIKELYNNAAAEILLKISSFQNNIEKTSYINNIIELITIVVKQLKVDFYIENDSSRYYLNRNIDNFKSIDSLLSFYDNDFKIQKKKPLKNIISDYDLYILNARDRVVLLIPFTLFTIGNSFIVFLLKKIQSIQENVTDKRKERLQTNLSVPELALLFKMTSELKPAIYKTRTKEELFQFISNNLQTKKSTEKGISVNKLRNEFSNPDFKAIEFWEEHLRTMLYQIKNLK